MGKKIDYKQLNASKRLCNEELLDEVAESEMVSREIVKKIVDSQSLYTLKTMEAGGMETIIYVYIGKFKVNLPQVQKMMANGYKP